MTMVKNLRPKTLYAHPCQTASLEEAAAKSELHIIAEGITLIQASKAAIISDAGIAAVKSSVPDVPYLNYVFSGEHGDNITPCTPEVSEEVVTYRLEWVRYKELHTGTREHIKLAAENGEWGKCVDHDAGNTPSYNEVPREFQEAAELGDFYCVQHPPQEKISRFAVYAWSSGNYDDFNDAKESGADYLIGVTSDKSKIKSLCMHAAVGANVGGLEDELQIEILEVDQDFSESSDTRIFERLNKSIYEQLNSLMN